MTIRSIQVPAPAVGKDWTTIVPGQYVWDLRTVTATLGANGGDTIPAGTVAVDSSGNGHNGTYFGTPQTAVGCVPGDSAVKFADVAGTFGGYATVPAAAFDPTGNFTVMCWISRGTDDGGEPLIACDNLGHYLASFTVAVNGQTLVTFRTVAGQQQPSATAANTVPTDNQPHHVAWTYNGTNLITYVDGVVKQNATFTHSALFGPVTAVGISASQVAGPIFGNDGTYIQDELSTHTSVLSAGTIAGATAAGRSSIGAYSAVVLANAPTSYWHLDEKGPGANRSVALVITDGSHTVAQIPGVAAQLDTTTFQYTWATATIGSDATGSPGAAIVALPKLILPPGYTIGTRTLGLKTVDTWTAISVWWDDAYQQGTVDFEDYGYDPGYYTYERRGS